MGKGSGYRSNGNELPVVPIEVQQVLPPMNTSASPGLVDADEMGQTCVKPSGARNVPPARVDTAFE